MIQYFTFGVALLLLYGCGGTDTASSQPAPSPSNTIEKRPLLLVRLSYDDAVFHHDAEVWHRKIFGFSEHELNHYLQEVSLSHFQFTPVNESEGTVNDGIISITLSRKHPDSQKNRLIHPDLNEALRLADAHIDFSTYDTDRNGALTPNELQLVFIVAGNEDAFSGPNAKPGVWAHSSCTERADTPFVDGVTLIECSRHGGYALLGERHGDHDATIGIIAHELGHAAFNLPDLYDTSEHSAGVGYFALMGAGMWGRTGLGELPGATPTHLCAWSKATLEWVTPTTITDALNVHVTFHATSSEAFNIVKLPINSHEYFLIENRHNSGYDRGLQMISFYFEGGLAIWHIDEQVIQKQLVSNTVNATVTHKGVDLEEAAYAVLDSSAKAEGNRENLFYRGNVDAFTAKTTPSTISYTHETNNIAVEDISAPSSTMSANISL